MKTLTRISVAVLLAFVFMPAAKADTYGVIRSWDTQRGGDLYGAETDALGYSAFESGLTARGHTVLDGVSELTAANLAGVDLFFYGTTSHVLTSDEAAAINSFVSNGGCVIVEADTEASEKASANSLLNALGLSSLYNGSEGGTQSTTAGLFTSATTWATVGPMGDLRNQQLGMTLTTDLDVGSGVLVAVNDAINAMVELQPFGDSGGRVLAVGDPLGFNLFQLAGSSYYNPNNQAAYINFFENQLLRPVPIPGAALLGMLGLSVAGAKLRKRRDT